MENRKNQIAIEDFVAITTTATLHRLFSYEKGDNAVALYFFYYLTAKWQKTNQIKAKKNYCMKALGWGSGKFNKAYSILKETGLVDIVIKRDKGKFSEWYIKINFIWRTNKAKKVVESLLIKKKPLVSKPTRGKRPTNALSKDNRNALSKYSGKKEEVKSYNPEDKELTDLLYSLVRSNYSWTKDKSAKAFQKDYQEMNKIHKLDGHKDKHWTYQQIKFVIEWSQKDSFWRQNIRSVSKLRKQFSTLVVRIKEQHLNPKNKGDKIAIYKPNL